MEKNLTETIQELDKLKDINQQQLTEVMALKQAVSAKDEESQKRQSMLEEKIKELEVLRDNMNGQYGKLALVIRGRYSLDHFRYVVRYM